MRSLILASSLALVPALLGAQAEQAAHAAVVPQPPTKLPLKHAPQPTTSAITAADLMTRLYLFADDSMQGREAGAAGNVKGTDYIASEVKRLGLTPAGEGGGYFQTIPFKTRTPDPTSTVTVGGAPMTYGSEWAAAGPESAAGSDVPVIYGGVLGDSASMISAEQAAGKLVVFGFGPNSLRAFNTVTRLMPSATATAVVLPQQFLPFVARPTQFVENPGVTQPTRVTIFFTPTSVAKVFDDPIAQLKPGAAGKTLSFSIRSKTEPVPYPARNVVAILPGSDPKLKGEYVAIGAHNDHVGFNHTPVDHDSIRIFNHIVRPGGAEDQAKRATPEQQAEVNTLLADWRTSHPGTSRADSISNGADDDGSGSVSVLEIAEKLVAENPKPKRSVLFVWHVGEEKGLLGSAYFTDHPTVPRDSIVAQLNIDMVGRGDAWDMTGVTKEGAEIHGNPNYLQVVGARRLSTELGDLVEKVNTEGKHGLAFDYAIDADGHPANIYCRSDHYEYARFGIPIAFFTTGGHSDYHQVTDEPEYIDYDHMARVDNFIGDLAMRVASLDHRIVVDHPKPDPAMGCRQ
jgi:peptidase M28-like protein